MNKNQKTISEQDFKELNLKVEQKTKESLTNYLELEYQVKTVANEFKYKKDNNQNE